MLWQTLLGRSNNMQVVFNQNGQRPIAKYLVPEYNPASGFCILLSVMCPGMWMSAQWFVWVCSWQLSKIGHLAWTFQFSWHKQNSDGCDFRVTCLYLVKSWYWCLSPPFSRELQCWQRRRPSSFGERHPQLLPDQSWIFLHASGWKRWECQILVSIPNVVHGDRVWFDWLHATPSTGDGHSAVPWHALSRRWICRIWIPRLSPGVPGRLPGRLPSPWKLPSWIPLLKLAT